MEVRQAEGVNAVLHNGRCLFIIILFVPLEDLGCLDSQRAVEINRDIRQFALPLELTEEVEDLLGTFNSKGWDNYLFAILIGITDGREQLGLALSHRLVHTVAIGGLHEQIIRVEDLGRVL